MRFHFRLPTNRASTENVDSAYVMGRVADLAKNADLSRFIL